MQMAQKGQSSILYLPVIYMNPNSLMCPSMPRNISIITFDQPLWWKAPQIRESPGEEVNAAKHHAGAQVKKLMLPYITSEPW